ncbi:MAG TPA: response regulator [Nitrospirota bacterium]|nr:response regulator [Nitrospirota bacterium]
MLRKNNVDVLLIDDEAPFLNDLAEGLRLNSQRLQVITATTAERALEMLRTCKFDVVLTDLNMPGMNGYQVLREVEHRHPGTPVIIMSAYARNSVADRLEGLRFTGYLEKPLDLLEVTEAILDAG